MCGMCREWLRILGKSWRLRASNSSSVFVHLYGLHAVSMRPSHLEQLECRNHQSLIISRQCFVFFLTLSLLISFIFFMYSGRIYIQECELIFSKQNMQNYKSSCFSTEKISYFSICFCILELQFLSEILVKHCFLFLYRVSLLYTA